jgi:NTE family protein
MNEQIKKMSRSHRKHINALVLQGGGALGAYQCGVFEAWVRTNRSIDWVVGVSIGAVNAALIAGNVPEKRLQRLHEFWELVSSGPGQTLSQAFIGRPLQNQMSSWYASVFGVPGLFYPRLNPLLLLGGQAPVLSYYDVAPLKQTLTQLVDFDLINDKKVRLSVGAVNVRTGNSVYFDNETHLITPDHILASGALPPGFAPVHIDGEDYWDGGIVSNTPLRYALDFRPKGERLLILQVDLFSARGEMPETMAQVAQRHKDIMYSSRTRANTDDSLSDVRFNQALHAIMGKLPTELQKDPNVVALKRMMKANEDPIDVVHLIYRTKPHEFESKDYEFSHQSMVERWEAGLRDMRVSMEHPAWTDVEKDLPGINVYDLASRSQVAIKRFPA